MAEKLPNLIIGSGRVATHFKHYFAMKGVPVLDWNRKEHTEADLRKRLERVSSVLMLIKDSALKEFRDAYLRDFEGEVAHFSGCLQIEDTEVFHPLMTFGPHLYTLPFYEKIHFAVSSKAKFREILPELSNPVFEINLLNKPLYHALCVMMGNFPQILWNRCLEEMKRLGVPQEAALLYLRKNLENFEANPSTSLTGPLARGDQYTIKKNIDALPLAMRDLYSAFVRFYEDGKQN